jgi:hypothetical protein
MAELSEKPEELAPISEEAKQAGEVPPQPAPEATAHEEPVQEPEEKPVIKLSKPSKKLAKKLLNSKVRFEDRLIGTRENPEAGEETEFIYRFKDAVQFLQWNYDDFWIGLDWTYSIDSRALQKWVGEVLGDKELAIAIEDKIKELAIYSGHKRYLKGIEHTKEIKGLMEYRLKQCNELITGETEA